MLPSYHPHDFNRHHSELREIEGEVGFRGKVHSEIEGEMIYLKKKKLWKET